jgi:hypothetical protein
MIGTRALALGTISVATITLGLAGTAGAELHRWTDAEGRVHVTQDLYKVPPEYRDQLDRAPAGKGSYMHIEGLNTRGRGGDPEDEAGAASAGAPDSER